jgi:opacity protein-like surface antigen
MKNDGLVKFLLLMLFVMAPLVAVASDFQGPIVEVGLTGSRTQTDVVFPNWFQADIDDTSINGHIAVGYGQRLGRYVLAGQLYYTLGNQESGSTTQRYQETDEVSTLSFELDNSWGIELQPGVLVNNATLVYLSLGYARTTGEWTLDRPYYQDRYSDRLDFDGYSLGVGIKRQLLSNVSSHLYGFVEIEKIWFQQESTAVTIAGSSFVDDYEPETLSVTLGIGWQF